MKKWLLPLFFVATLTFSACKGSPVSSESSSHDHSQEHSSEHSHDHSSEHSHDHSSEHSHEHSESESSQSSQSGHTHDLKHFDAIDATCENPGKKEYQICLDCGRIFDMEGNEISVADLVIPALNHDYGAWSVTKAPTCTEDGIETSVCKRDPSHVRTRKIDATDHSWGSWQTVTEPTCSAQGLRRRICLVNPTHIDEEPIEINPSNHKFGEWEYVTLPDCENKGTMRRVCEYNSNHYETKEVDPIDHDYQFSKFEWDDNDKSNIKAQAVLVCSNNEEHIKKEAATVIHYQYSPATCDAVEVVAYKASYDNKEEIKLYDGDPQLNHQYEFNKFIWGNDGTTASAYLICNNDETHTQTVEVVVTSKVTTERSCEVDEVTTYTATYGENKDNKEVVTASAYGEHVSGEPVKENEVAPTCSKAGSYDEVVYCFRCGKELSRTAKEVEKTPHTLSEPVKENEVAPTCTEKGGYDLVVYCSVCHEELSRAHQEVAATGHHEAKRNENEVAPTCTKAGSHDEVTYCTTCNKVLSTEHVVDPATGHKYGDWTIDVAPTCTADGSKHRVCEYDNSHIGNEIIPATGHTPSEAVKEKLVEATYTSEGSYEEVVYCSVCHVEISRTPKVIPMLEHHYGEWTTKTAPTCTTAGVERRECTDPDCDAYEERPMKKLTHSYKETVVPPTCTEKGYTVHECEYCHDQYITDYVDALGHTWDHAEASCSYSRTCKVCGEIEPALEHDYELKEELVGGETCVYNRVNVCKNDPSHRQIIDQVEHHQYINVIASEPTCTSEGVMYHKCSLCNEYEMDGENKKAYSIDVDTVNGHDWILGTTDPVTHIRHDECSICHATRDVVSYESNTTDATSGDKLNENPIELKDATLNVNDKTAEALAGKDITLSVDTKTTDDIAGLSDEDKEKIGDNVVYDFTMNDGTQDISEFGEGGKITITIPYVLGPDEDPEGIVVFYITDDGDLIEITEYKYSNNTVTFEVEHFSNYAVGKLSKEEICARKGHIYKEVSIEGDCTHDSYVMLVCSRCGHSIEKADSRVPATGHQYAIVEEVAATCNANGYKLEKCSVCGHEKKTTYPMLGHSYKVFEVVDPKCEEDGYTVYKCEHCDATYISDYTEMTGHTWGEWKTTVEATCHSYGKAEQHCEHCEAVQYKTIAMTAHTPGEAQIESGIVPTCSSTGYHYETVRCTECNALISKFRVEDAKIPHKWGEWVVIKEANCTESGLESRTCEYDGSHVETREIAATGHIAGEAHKENEVAPTCTTSGSYDLVVRCKTCNKILSSNHVHLSSLGHSYGDWIIDVEPTCNVGGSRHRVCENDPSHVEYEELSATGRHSYKEYKENEVAPTCSKAGGYDLIIKCEHCGKVYSKEHITIAATGHKYGEWNVINEPTCTIPGLREKVCENDNSHVEVEEIAPLGHIAGEPVKENEVAATCTTAGHYDEVTYCTVCKREISRRTVSVPALNHNWGEWKVIDEGSCTVDHTEQRVCLNDETHVETKIVKATGHTLSTAVRENIVNPTCTKEGSYDEVVYCSVCGEEISRTKKTIEATGHIPGLEVKENEVAPTCHSKGGYDEVVYCSVCHEELSRTYKEIPMTEHTPSEAVKENIVNPTCTKEGSYDEVIYCSVCKTEISRVKKSISPLGHNPGEVVKENIVAPTCTNEGSYEEVVYCTVCKVEISRTSNVVPATGHNYQFVRFDWADDYSKVEAVYVCEHDDAHIEKYEATLTSQIIKEPTCEENGIKQYNASYDGHNETKDVTINKVDHVAAQPVKENEVAPTCSKEGSYDSVIYCETCGEELARESHKIDKIPHTPATIVKENEVAPTCTSEGSYDEVVYCSVCGEELSRTTKTVAKLDHVPAEAVKENEVAPTCSKEGSYEEVVYCSVCGEELSRTVKSIEKIPHTEARPVKENEVAPTCTKEGSYDLVIYCSVCNIELAREHKSVPATGHTPSEAVIENLVPATCDTKGSYDEVVYCSVCGEELSRTAKEIDATGHKYGEWRIVKEATCLETGLRERVCEYDPSHVETEIIPLAEHTYNKDIYEHDEYNHYNVCSVCEKHVNISYHQFDEGNTCTICGYHTEVAPECDHEHLPILTLNISDLGYCEGSKDWEYVYCPVCNTNYALNATSMAQPACKFDYSRPTTVKLTYKGEEMEFMKITCSVCGKSIYAQEKDESTDGCVHIGHLWMAVENPDGTLMVLEGSTTYESHEYKQYELKVGCEGSYINYYGCPKCGKLHGIEQVALKGCETTEEYITNEDGSVTAIITCSKCGLHVEATSKNTYISQCEYDQYIYYHVYDKENEYLEFSNSQRISDHKIEQTVEFVNGKDCEDGYTVSSVCSVCGQSLGSQTGKGHNYYSERFDLNEYGVDGYYIVDKCQICGAENLRERRVFFEIESETNDYKTEDGTAVLEYHEYNESNGYSFFMRTIAEEDGCYRTVDFHFEIDIKDKFHREFDFVEKEAHHDVDEALTTYELLHDYCYQGVRVTRHCIECGEDFIDTVYNHPKTTKNYISLKDEYGCCDGYIENEVCQICGEQVGNTRLELEPDSHKLSVDTTSYTDDMGYKHVSEIQVCKVCGLEYHIDSVKKPYKDEYTYEVEVHEYLVIRDETVYESSNIHYEHEEPQPQQPIRIGLDYSIAEAVRNNIDEFYNQYPQYKNWYFDVYQDYSATGYERYDIANRFDIVTLQSDAYYALAKQGSLMSLNEETYAYGDINLKDYSFNEALVDETLYGLPYGLTNGYFMYYDKYVISEDIVNNLSAIIAQCKAANKYFALDYTNAWYAASFYHAVGAYSEWDYYGNNIFTGYNDNYYSDEGAIAANVLYQLAEEDIVMNRSGANCFEEGAAVVISGIWDYQTALEALGEDRLGIAVLPSLEFDGGSYQLKPFMSHNYFAAVNTGDVDEEKAEVINALIRFLNSEYMQEKYCEYSSMILTNINANEYCSEKYTEAMNVLDEQAELGYRVQGYYPNNWWNLVPTILRDMQNGASAEEALGYYNDNIARLVTVPHDHEYVRSELYYYNGKDCSDGGYEALVCSVCGDSKRNSFYGHNCSDVNLSKYTEDDEVVIEARALICDRCGEFDYLEVSYYDDEYVAEHDKTVEYDGITFTGDVFSYDGTIYYLGTYNKVISDCEGETHRLIMFTDGERQYVRHDSNYVDNHDYQLIERHFNKDNDCESGGYEIYKCSKCEHVRQEDFYGHYIYGQDRSVYLEDKTPLIYAYVYQCERCDYVENIEVKIENEKLFNFSEEDITYNGVTYHCKKYTYINGDVYLAYGSYQEEISECKTLNRELTIYFDGENTYAVERNFDYDHHGAYSYRYSGNCEKELYVEIYCERCGEFLKSYYTKQPHQYNEDGYCVICGHYNGGGSGEAYTYTREDVDYLYDQNLGLYEYLINYAKGINDDNLRYVIYAQAEAELLNSGLITPTNSQGGYYAVSRVAPHTIPNAICGFDADRLKGVVVVNSDEDHPFISASDREALIELWNNARVSGEEYDPISYLLEQGYTLDDTYRTSFSYLRTFDILNTYQSSDVSILVNFVDGLLEYDNLGNLNPQLATSYEVSEDGLTYTFHLREDAYWYTYEGEQYAQVTADDFVAGFQHMLDAQGGLEYLVEDLIVGCYDYLYKGNKNFNNVGVKALDNFTLQITLTRPTSYFVTELTYSCFLPMNRAYFTSKGGKFGNEYEPYSELYTYGKDYQNILYNGAYLPEYVDLYGAIILEANENYYDANNVNLDRIEFYYTDGSEDNVTYWNQLKSNHYSGGTLNFANGVAQLAMDDGLFDDYAYVTPLNGTTFFAGVNVNRGNWSAGSVESPQSYFDAVNTHQALNNVNFRRALQHAFDRVSYNAIATGEEIGAYSLRNMLTHPEFVSLSEDVTLDDGSFFAKGTMYYEIVEYYLANKYGREVNLEDGQDGWYNPELAYQYLDMAKAELGDKWQQVQIDYITYNSKSMLAQAEFYKQNIESVLGPDNVCVNIIICDNINDYYQYGGIYISPESACYDIGVGTGWGPDYIDPSSYLDIFDRRGYMSGHIGLDGEMNSYTFGGGSQQPHYHNYQLKDIYYHNGEDCSEGGECYYYCAECGDSYWDTFYGHELSLSQEEIYDNEGHVVAIVNNEKCDRCGYLHMSLAAYDDDYATKTDAELEFDGIVYQGYKITINGLDMYYFSGEYTKEVSECESNHYMINYFYRDGEFMAFPTTKNYQNHGEIITTSEGNCDKGRHVTETCAVCGKVINEYYTTDHVINDEGVCIYCGKETLGTITIWCDEMAGDSTRTLVEQFRKLAGSQYSFDYQIEYHGEGSAASEMIRDLEAGADIYFFPQDQLGRLVRAGALSELSEDAASYVTTYNDGGSALAATYDDAYYAFPATADNGYFMYYDASFFKDVDMTDLDAIYAKCKKGGRTIYFEYGSAWYNSAFFLGYGAHCEYTVDADGNFVAYEDTYDSPEGLEAARAMARYFTDKFVFINGSSTSAFKDGAAVVISGTWDYSTALSILGDNLGATKLPRVRSRDGGELVQLASFCGNKLVGTKPQKSKTRSELVEALAAYLTSEDAQRMRFEQTGWGPSNINLQQDPDVANFPALSALFAQNEFAKPLGEFSGSWWSIAGNIGAEIANGIDPETAVATYKESLPGTIW